MSELTIAEVFAAVAARVPDRFAILAPGRNTTYAALDLRSTRLGHRLLREGIGLHRERAALRPWESGQDHIGLLMYNGTEYLEAEFAVLKARAAAININHRYVDEELRYLADDAGLAGLIFHSRFAPQVDRLRSSLPGLRFLVQVADDSGNPMLDGAVHYEAAIAAEPGDRALPTASPDDLHILYTGGTTGMPKGVLWCQADIIMAALGGRRPGRGENTVADFIRCAEHSASRTLATGPFMHASGRWTALSQLLLGNTVVLPRNHRHFDADDILSTLERERVVGLNITGDAVAGPLVAQLGRKRYDLLALRSITSGAAILSDANKAALIRALPSVRITDTIGSSETGPQASAVTRSGEPAPDADFTAAAGTTILTEDLSAVLPRDNDAIGWLARSGRVPLGYLGDAERTARSFPTLDGIRYAVPGDRARWSDAGEIALLGRDGATINTGGEKVFAEEVERALKRHAAVRDAIVCGRPSERWGQEVVAIVALADGHVACDDALLAAAAQHLARYKLPKAIIYHREIYRSPSGKPDYAWARSCAIAANDESACVAAR